RTADGYASPARQVDPRMSSFHANIHSASQQGLHFVADHLHTHRPFEGNGTPFNRADDFALRLLRRSLLCGGPEGNCTGNSPRANQYRGKNPANAFLARLSVLGFWALHTLENRGYPLFFIL